MAVGKNLTSGINELIEEAKETMGVAKETEDGNEFSGSVTCTEDSDDSVFTLCNNVMEGKHGNAGEDCEIMDEQCEKENHGAVESGHKEPKMHMSVMKCPDEERKKWMEGCEKELGDFS